ncbi:MAG: hypothetical protein JWQ12_92 [Glaciihabitans sp.]|jgi:hypothetical protein|nr:hypothetical protein [Glaciihabitans sp.]
MGGQRAAGRAGILIEARGSLTPGFTGRAHGIVLPMSRRLLAAALSAALGAALVATLAGCASSGSAKPTTTAPPAAAATATPTPTASAPLADSFTPSGTYTCTSILPPATLSVFKSKASAGFALQKDFAARMKAIASPLVAFEDLGGILCQWAYSGATNTVNYGFSAIPDADAKTQRASLAAEGYTESTGPDGGILVTNPDTANFPDTYLFANGYWFYASDADVLTVITQNLFENG